MTGTAGTAMITDHSVETTQKTSPRLRGENGGQGNHTTALAHSALPKNNSMDRALYTDSKTSEENSNHPTPSGIVEASMSWPNKKAAPRPQQHDHSQALQSGQSPTVRHQPPEAHRRIY